MKNETASYYVWFDTEFTGLDLADARLLQVAALITDLDCRPVAPDDPGIDLAIRLEPDATISEWVETHLSELLAVCRSDRAVDIAEADQQLGAYVDRMVGPRSEDIRLRPVLAGNSLHMDWALAGRDLPGFLGRLHYRHLDVTAFKLQWVDWLRREEFDKDSETLLRAHLPFDPGPMEGRPHDARYDILASIAELQFYRKHLYTAP